MGFGLGEASYLQWKDISGIMTSYQYEETNRYYPTTFLGRDFWDCYNTNYQFDPMQTKMRYTLKVPRKTIELTSQGYSMQENSRDSNREQNEYDRSLITNLVNELAGKGTKEISRGEFWRLARERGFESTPSSISVAGMLLSSLGVERDLKNYSFYQEEALISPPTKSLILSSNSKKKQLVKAGKK